MALSSTLIEQGNCPKPFLEADLFPSTSGFLEGRFCSSVRGIKCCLPCPHTKWLYPDNFDSIIERVSWINIPSLLCSVFLIASFALLPVSKTHRHYLSLCLVTSIAMMNVAFIIPLGAKPTQCDDSITPNNMRSSTTCAISGALVIAGGWFGVMWVCLITLALHLQICWHVTVGEIFTWATITAGWAIPTVGVTMTLIMSGVSFRFGNTCHVNAKNSLASLWIPLMMVASFTLFMQLATFIYCVRVYFASLGDSDDNLETSVSIGGGKSFNSKRRIPITKEAYHRVQRVIQLQWRSILIVLIIVADVIYLATVFVSLNQVESALSNGNNNIIPWLDCLVTTEGQKDVCFAAIKTPRISETTIISVLILLSLNGFWCLLLLGRLSMLTGWWELITRKSSSEDEFLSADVRTFKSPADYEMLVSPSDHSKHPDLFINSPRAVLYSTRDRSALPRQDSFLKFQPDFSQNQYDCLV